MGLLKFTKDYTSSDDSSKLTGSELGTLQADIAAVINGGLSNANVSSDAAIVESKLSFDTASGHNHDGSNSRTLSSGAFRGFRQGAGLLYVTAATMKAQSGVLDIAGTLYTRTSYSSTINMATNGHWVEGTTQEGASQIVYIYAYNDSGSTWDIKFWLQAPQYANTGTDDSSIKIYRYDSKWYRCLGYFYNDSSQNIQSKTVENIDGPLMFGDVWTTDKDGSAFGDTTVYQALTDGFVSFSAGAAGGGNYLYTDSANPPTTQVFKVESDAGAVIGEATVVGWVKRGDYWKVDVVALGTARRWTPLMRKTIE